MSQCIDGVQVRRLPCRIDAAGKTDNDPKANPFTHRERIGHREQVLDRTQHQGADGIPGKDAEYTTDDAADDPDDGRLIDEHAHHLSFLGADAAHDADLLDPLVHGHHHDVEDRDAGNDHGDPADCSDKSRDGAKGCIDAAQRRFAVHHADDLVVLALVELFLYGGFYVRRVPGLDFHDNFIVIAVPVVGIFKPRLGHDYGIIGTDIETHAPLLDDAGDP